MTTPKSPYEIVEETIRTYETGPRSKIDNGDNLNHCVYLGDEEARCAFSRLCQDTPEVTAALKRAEGNGCFSVKVLTSDQSLDMEEMPEESWRQLLKPEYDGHPVAFYKSLQNLHDSDDYWKAEYGGGNRLTLDGYRRWRQVLREYQLPLDQQLPVATAYEIIEETIFWYTRNKRSTVPREGGKVPFCRYINGDCRCAFSRICKTDDETKEQLGNLEGTACFDDDEIDWRGLLLPRYATLPDSFYADLQELHDTEEHWAGFAITLEGLINARSMMNRYRNKHQRTTNE